MSKKFTGFERSMIYDAVESWMLVNEKKIKSGKGRRLFAPGYFNLVGAQLLRKVDEMTLKESLKQSKIHEEQKVTIKKPVK